MSRTGRRDARPRHSGPVGWVDLSDSQRAAIEEGERHPAVTPERAQLLLPHRPAHERSEQKRLQAALRPKDVTGFVNWARWMYRQEPPTRLHDQDTAKDGAPRMSGMFMAWLQQGESACSLDAEGAFRTPFRCALYTLHGRDEETVEAAMADLALDVAAGTLTWDRIAAEHHIDPPWVRRLAVAHALGRLWDIYSPQPR